MYMYKEDLALNNLQWLICHKIKSKPNLGKGMHPIILPPVMGK